MELTLIRHAQTPGNGERRYVGAVDQPLSQEGLQQAQAAGPYPDVHLVYVSTLQRTHQTAALMFPNARQVIVDGVQEMDFGAFAGRTADEMVDDADYRAWVDGNCEGTCPGGECRAEFSNRVCAAVEQLLCQASARGEEHVVLVAHGGTMMAFLDRFVPEDGRAYWEWLVGNCQGYRIGVEFTDGPDTSQRGIAVRSVRRWPDF